MQQSFHRRSKVVKQLRNLVIDYDWVILSHLVRPREAVSPTHGIQQLFYSSLKWIHQTLYYEIKDTDEVGQKRVVVRHHVATALC